MNLRKNINSHSQIGLDAILLLKMMTSHWTSIVMMLSNAYLMPSKIDHFYKRLCIKNVGCFNKPIFQEGIVLIFLSQNKKIKNYNQKHLEVSRCKILIKTAQKY